MATKAKIVRRAPQLSSLFVLATLFIGSGFLRIALEAAPVFAKDVSGGVEPPEVAEMDLTRSLATSNPDFEGLLLALRDREEQVEARERELQDRMKALEISDRVIEEKIAALKQAEENLRETLSLATGASESDLAQLTIVYEQMKPKEAAALFEEMAPEFAAGFLTRMKPDAAAAILAGLEPKTAYTVSVVMAGKNARVPKQ